MFLKQVKTNWIFASDYKYFQSYFSNTNSKHAPDKLGQSTQWTTLYGGYYKFNITYKYVKLG